MPNAKNPSPRENVTPGQTGQVSDSQRPTADEQHLDPKLPHERDQSIDDSPQEPRRVIKQAKEDLDRGLADTDKGPELDRAYKQQK